MDTRVARAYEAAYVAAKRLRSQLRFTAFRLEDGVRVVRTSGGTPFAWADLLRSLDHVEHAKADREIDERTDPRGRPRPSPVDPKPRKRERVFLDV